MKFKKTPQAKRKTYSYFHRDGNGEIKEVVIHPGENGVTEVDIKLLHSLDDSEVYYNIKNCKSENEGEKWNISIDSFVSDEDDAQDKSRIMEQIAYTFEEEVSPEVERLREVVETLTDSQRELYKLVVLDGYSLTEAARLMGTSIPNIHKRMERIYKQIKNKF
jgi:RNA polymerase sigma factor (sigma-70 family)